MVFTVRLLQQGIQYKKKNISRYVAFVRHHNNAYIMQNDTVCMRHGMYCHQWLFYVVTGRFCSTAYLAQLIAQVCPRLDRKKSDFAALSSGYLGVKVERAQQFISQL